jgi:hypothetical protein
MFINKARDTNQEIKDNKIFEKLIKNKNKEKMVEESSSEVDIFYELRKIDKKIIQKKEDYLNLAISKKLFTGSFDVSEEYHILISQLIVEVLFIKSMEEENEEFFQTCINSLTSLNDLLKRNCNDDKIEFGNAVNNLLCISYFIFGTLKSGICADLFYHQSLFLLNKSISRGNNIIYKTGGPFKNKYYELEGLISEYRNKNILYSGSMPQLKGKIKHWSDKFCIIKKSGFYAYIDEKYTKIKCEIPMNTIQSYEKLFLKKTLVLKITSGKGEFFFKNENEKDLMNWIEIFDYVQNLFSLKPDDEECYLPNVEEMFKISIKKGFWVYKKSILK